MDENVVDEHFHLLRNARKVFVFLFSNNRYISAYCHGIYKINRFIRFHAGLKRVELFKQNYFDKVFDVTR